jgi:hypothetical protein
VKSIALGHLLRVLDFPKHHQPHHKPEEGRKGKSTSIGEVLLRAAIL